MTKKAAPADVSFQSVDDELKELDSTAKASSFKQDCLKLARDCATLGQIYKQEVNHAKSVRIQKVTHLKQQNLLGADFIQKFMKMNVRHVSGRSGEMESAVDEARKTNKNIFQTLGIYIVTLAGLHFNFCK